MKRRCERFIENKKTVESRLKSSPSTLSSEMSLLWQLRLKDQ
jgi:hypothetical protein